MKLFIFAIILIGAVLATGNANADVEPEERAADPGLLDTIKNGFSTGIKAVKNGLAGLGGRADVEPEERNRCGMLRCGPLSK